jgi:hypothetical protein
MIPMRSAYLAFALVASIGLTACGGADAEPSEEQMKDAMLEQMNHPPGIKVSDPVKITFFKKGACDNPTPQGRNCTFSVTVSSANIGASMYNNIPGGVFYKDKDSGKWMMRPPF